jgi:hypothetical protein
MFRASSISAVLLAASLSCVACIDASKRLASGGNDVASPQEQAAALVKACPKGTQPAADGLIDDLEDNDNKVAKLGGRDGDWFTSVDPNGSTMEPSPFKMTEGGAGGSKYAAHAFGQTSDANGAWGAQLGATFAGAGAYDASVYAGISFKAKIGEHSTKKIRFKVADVNTHPDGGVCKTCWNHFGNDLTLTPEWVEYKLPFSEMTQEKGWGDPQKSITPGKLIAINWSIGPGQLYDLWVDDIAFFECAP